MNYLFGPPVPIKTSAADFLGFPVVIDPLMEPGTLEFHDNAGCVVGRIVNPATSSGGAES